MTINDPTKLNNVDINTTFQLSGNGDEPIKPVKPAITDIFRAGLRREEAKAYSDEALQIFDRFDKKANGGNDNGIWEDNEYQSYKQNESQIFSSFRSAQEQEQLQNNLMKMFPSASTLNETQRNAAQNFVKMTMPLVNFLKAKGFDLTNIKFEDLSNAQIQQIKGAIDEFNLTDEGKKMKSDISTYMSTDEGKLVGSLGANNNQTFDILIKPVSNQPVQAKGLKLVTGGEKAADAAKDKQITLMYQKVYSSGMREGLKRTDIERDMAGSSELEERLKLFDSIDTDHSGEIDFQELEMRVYRLSLDDIAERMKKSAPEFEKMMQETLGYDSKNFDWSKAKVLTDKELQDAMSKIKQPVRVHVGMTYAQAKKIGGETLRDFNKISKDKKTITGNDLLMYRKGLLGDYAITDVVNTINHLSGDKKVRMLQEMAKSTYDERMIKAEFKNIDKENATLNDYLNVLNISEDEWNSARTSKEKGQILSEKVKEMLEKDMDYTNPESLISQTMNRLARGEFTQKELEQGYREKITDPEDLFRMASVIVAQTNMATFSSINIQVFTGEESSTEDKSAMMIALYSGMDACPGIAAILATLGIETSKSKEERLQLENVAAESVKAEHLESPAAALLLDTMVDDMNSGALAILMDNNPDLIETIENITNTMINELPDSEEKEQFRQTIGNYVSNVKTTGSTGVDKEALSGAPAGASTAFVRGSSNPAVTSVMLQGEESKRFWQDKGFEEFGEDQRTINEVNRITAREMDKHEKIRYTAPIVKNLQNNGYFTKLAKVYGKLQGKDRDDAYNYLHQMPGFMLADVMISSDKDVQRFLISEGFLSFAEVVVPVRKNLDLLNKDCDQLEEQLKERLVAYFSNDGKDTEFMRERGLLSA